MRTLSSGKVVWRGTLVDPAWWNAVWNTVRFSFVSVFFETVLGLIVALVLNAEFQGRSLVRAAILIPWAIPTIVSAKMWAWMLNDQFGILNDIGMNLGLLIAEGRMDRQPRHRDDGGADRRYLEDHALHGAADPAGIADGAARYLRGGEDRRHQPGQGVLQVTLPLIKPALMVAVIFRMLDALRIF